MDDHNIEIYTVPRTTPEYVVIGPNLNLRLVIGPSQRATFFNNEKASFPTTW